MINYEINKGDTLWNIAMQYGISLNELIAANPQIHNPHLIYPNDSINIPASHTDNYVVAKGDNMWNIAKKHNVAFQDLKNINKQIKNPNLIYPGDMLNIPSDTKVQEILPSNKSNLEMEVVRLVNENRTSSGLNELNESQDLTNVARVKSNDFIINHYFSHNSPTYGTPFEMLNAFDIPYTSAAENIASGQQTPEEVMRFWLSSPGHRDNILNPNYTDIGVGVSEDQNGNLYWTQLFTRN